MRYALFPPHSPWRSNRVTGPPLPHYTTNDRAVAQVFHSCGWIILTETSSSIFSSPSVANNSAIKRASNDDVVVVDDSDGDENEKRNQRAKEESEATTNIRSCCGLTELHFPGVLLEEDVFGGPQVEERVKWTIMWRAGWDMEKEVDLRYVGSK